MQCKYAESCQAICNVNMHCTHIFAHTDGWLIVRFKADCLTRDLGQWVECPPWGLETAILCNLYDNKLITESKIFYWILWKCTQWYTWRILSFKVELDDFNVFLGGSDGTKFINFDINFSIFKQLNKHIKLKYIPMLSKEAHIFNLDDVLIKLLHT